MERLAQRFGVTDRALDNLLGAATAGLFFVPPHRFSAANLFGLAHAAAPDLHRQRLGAFLGGMTEVMCRPIADAAVRHGAVVRTGTPVARLLGDDRGVHGVRTAGGEQIRAEHVVLATALGAAQRLLAGPVGDQRWFRPMLGATITPSVNIQFELDRPSTPVDRTTFGPGTCVGNFAEQSRTTFQHVPGRCQVTLTPPLRYLDMGPDRVARRAVDGLRRIGIDIGDSVRRYRVLTQPDDFLGLEPGNFERRPDNRTPVPDLVLAGDYTDQRWLSLMEGAVRSGRRAATVVDDRAARPASSALGGARLTANIKTRHHLDHPAEALLRALSDPDFHDAKVRYVGGPGSGVLEFDHDPENGRLRVVTRQRIDRRELPGIARRFVGGAVYADREERWRLASTWSSADFDLDVPDAPVRADGRLSLLDGSGTDCTLTTRTSLSIRAPLLARGLERSMADTVRDWLADEYHFTRRWLAEHEPHCQES